MIVVVRKYNVLLVLLIFLLAIAVYSLNVTGPDQDRAAVNSDAVQKVVILDPGHGGEDPGVVNSDKTLKEKELNLTIALKVKALLEKGGCKVIMTREDDRLVYQEGTTSVTEKRRQDLQRRKKMMDESGADIVVSIHMNGFPQTQYSGAQVFFPHNSPESQKLAVAIQKSIQSTVDPNNKREAMLKGKANEKPIMILRDLKTTTAIVECGFLSNLEDQKRLATAEYQDKLADAIKSGVNSYLGIK